MWVAVGSTSAGGWPPVVGPLLTLVLGALPAAGGRQAEKLWVRSRLPAFSNHHHSRTTQGSIRTAKQHQLEQRLSRLPTLPANSPVLSSSLPTTQHSIGLGLRIVPRSPRRTHTQKRKRFASVAATSSSTSKSKISVPHLGTSKLAESIIFSFRRRISTPIPSSASSGPHPSTCAASTSLLPLIDRQRTATRNSLLAFAGCGFPSCPNRQHISPMTSTASHS